jgi:RNHCP domain/Sgf11 (transcriptional regulation protein)
LWRSRPRIAPARPVRIDEARCLLPRRFTRTYEDFRCSNCGRQVAGNGYTNHCPACLWSKHVDVHPGDRAETCRALMRPAALQYERGAFVVIHECLGCGVRRRNRVARDDDLSSLLAS